MKIKLDENLPARLIEGLAELGHDVDSVPLERSLDNRTRKFGAHRRRPNGFLITQDLDFSDVRQFAPGTHKGILLVRLANPSRQRLADRMLGIFSTGAVETWQECFVVVTDLKIRVQRPS
jgi:predicted nuclease of predicted toxin-antitoxin system